MAYNCPRDLDGFLPYLAKPDTRLRQQIGADLLAFLAEPCNSIACQDIGHLVDGLVPWMQSSNYKVSSTGIEVMTYLIDRLGTDFRPYLQTVLPNVIDRLGDAKDSVREKSQLLILKLLERSVLTPQTLLEKLSPGFSHKNSKIREEVLRCLVNILNEHGAQSLTLNRFIPDIVKLLSDPTSTVRDTAFSTLIDLYKHVGEKLRVDLQKRNIVPASKWSLLVARFDEAKANGELLPTASKSMDLNIDEVDRMIASKPLMGARKTNLSGAIKQRAQLAPSSAGSGGVDEDTFIRSFDDVPRLQIFSAKEIIDHMKSVNEIISDATKDWNKRVDALKKIRSIVLAGALNYDDFYVCLKSFDIPFQAILRDLRSQVVREACITIAYLSQEMGSKFDKMAEFLLPTIVQLIQNSAKVMATAGLVTVRFIVQHCQSPRLIPIITSNAMTSKSKDIRRSCCEVVEIILTQWPLHTLEKHVAILQEMIKKGVADADPEARVISRKAFRGFRDHFPDQAENLLQSLEPSYRRALQGDQMSSSSSNSNLASGFKTPRQYGTRTLGNPQSASGSTENLCSGPTNGGLQRVPSLPRNYRQNSGIPVLRNNSGRKGFRSNSAIDLQAAQRAKARAQYAAISRNKITSGTASLPRPRKTPETVTTQSPERLGRTRNRTSQSQPTSRSGSPSSRLAYLYNRSDHESPRPRRLSSGIPRSTQGSRDTSRETSPNRGSLHKFRTPRTNDRPPMSPVSRPVLAQKILQQSLEAENAFADVFNDSPTSDHYRNIRKGLRTLDSQHSDESETSSVCSERSFDSYRRPSDSYSWSGSQQRLTNRDLWEPSQDINEIIVLCASTTWQERKDGLLSLQYFMNNYKDQMSSTELKHLTEIFTKMFMDSHTKGLSVFLDTLHEFIKIYRQELQYWVYVLLQKVFLKLGCEILNSVQVKLMNTLEIIKNNFPLHLLFSNVYRFFIDATQTPNAKVKCIALSFLTSLCHLPDSGDNLSVKPAKQALLKIITFSQDMKSPDTRNAARICIVAIFNCNTAEATLMLADLPKECQEIASNIVNNHMRKSSTSSEPGSPVVSSSPKPLSPGTPTTTKDGLDHEEIYRSLRKTTAEIQNYSYEALGSKLDRDRDTTSQDSGISQMSVGNDVKNDIASLEDRMEELNIRPSYAQKSGPKSLPYTPVNGASENNCNGYRSLGDLKDADVIKSVFENCALDSPAPREEKRKLFSLLIEVIKQGQTTHLIQHFRKLLRILIDNLNEQDDQMKIVVLQLLTTIFQCGDMKDGWSNFVELLTLRVLSAHTEEKRDVVKAAEETASAMKVFPFNTVVNTLTPMIHTSTDPTLLGAVKMLTKLIEANPDDVTDEHLHVIMPGLIKGSDHSESAVRKSSIFCMVALHKAVGEERLSKYISMLTGSKVKLLRLYISRSQQNTSVPTSPKNVAS